MKKIIIMIIIVGGLYSNKPELFDFTGQIAGFSRQGNEGALVFTHKRCGKPCSDAISLLNNRSIAFTEYKLDGNQANRDLWKKHGGVNSFPNMVIGDENIYGSYKGMIVSRLAMSYGESVLTQPEKFYMNKHFVESAKPKLVMYSASWCPYCKKLRKGLNQNGVSFLEIDVEKSSRRKDIIKTMDIGGYPTVYYGYKRIKDSRLKNVMAEL